MKIIIIILCFALLSCKSEIKIENDIDKSVAVMWHNFVTSNPEFKNDDLPESDPFHNNEYDANRLADLIVNGKKKAGSGLYIWYKDANADLPKIGTKSIVTNFDGKARAIIKIRKVDTIPFNKIPESYAALDMGTNIDALTKWKKAHWDFFESALKESDQEPTEDMLVVCQWFDTIWTEKNE